MLPRRGEALEEWRSDERIRRRLEAVHRSVPRASSTTRGRHQRPADRQPDLLHDQRDGARRRGQQPTLRGQRPATRDRAAGRRSPKKSSTTCGAPTATKTSSASPSTTGLICGPRLGKVGYKFTKPPEEKKVDEDLSRPRRCGRAAYGIDDRDDGRRQRRVGDVHLRRPALPRTDLALRHVRRPRSRHPKEMCWIAQRMWRPIQDVQVDSRYAPAARKKVSANVVESRWSTGDGDR